MLSVEYMTLLPTLVIHTPLIGSLAESSWHESKKEMTTKTRRRLFFSHIFKIAIEEVMRLYVS